MWPNIFNMFGIGGGGAPAPAQKGAGNPLDFSENALASGGWEEPTVEEPVTGENLMLSRNPEKSAEMQRALKYKRLNWAPDDTIDKSIWDQINPPAQTKGETTATPNSPGSTPPPSANVSPPAQTTPASGAPAQKASMFGQFGDPKKAMGSIWDQMKGFGGKVKEGITALDKKLEENYAASGYGGPDWKNPYDPEKPAFTAGGGMTGADIDEVSTDEESYKKNVQAQLDWQNSPEGQNYLEIMQRGQRQGDYAAGAAGAGGPAGGIINSLFSKPWNYEVKSKHLYQPYRGN